MIRDVMVAMTHTEQDAPALRSAIALARARSAHLAVVLPLDLPMMSVTGYGTSPLLLDDTFDVLRRQQEKRAEALRDQLRCEDISFEVRVAEGVLFSANAMLALHARYSDLVVIGAATGPEGDASVVRGVFAALLFESGRPVLVIPPKWTPTFPVARITVGWTPTPESTRAVHDAMDFLCDAQHVHLAVIEPLVGERQHGDEPGADMARHLARHGLEVEVVVRQAARNSIASELLLQVSESGSQMLVVGGYGHSRAREWAFGGATHGLLSQAQVPVLFSH